MSSKTPSKAVSFPETDPRASLSPESHSAATPSSSSRIFNYRRDNYVFRFPCRSGERAACKINHAHISIVTVHTSRASLSASQDFLRRATSLAETRNEERANSRSVINATVETSRGAFPSPRGRASACNFEGCIFLRLRGSCREITVV